MNKKVVTAKRKAGRALRRIIDEARRYIEAEDELERELRSARGDEDFKGRRKSDD